MDATFNRDKLQMEEVRGFAEICRWLADEHPMQEVMRRLMAVDLDLLEWFGRFAQEKEVVELCGDLPYGSIQVVNEFCALSRTRSRVRLACEC